MFQAYVDDSASDSEERKFYLCAYVNTASEWLKFSEEWDSALRSIPAINYLHMVDAWSFRGEFAGWSETNRNEKLETMAAVIKKYHPVSVEVSVSRKVFDEVFKDVAPFFLKNPYFICFYGMILAVARLHSDWKLSVPVDFIFDETTTSRGTVMFYDYVKSDFPQFSTILGSTPVFRDDKAIMPLQAADMLAWYVRRKNEGRDEHIPGGPSLRNVSAVIEMNEESLKSMAEKMSKISGVDRLQTKKTWVKLRPLILHQISTRTWPRQRSWKYLFQGFLKWLSALVRF